MEFNQRYPLNPSYYFVTLLTFMHMGAITTLLALKLPIPFILTLGIICGISLAKTLQRYALLLTPQSIVGFWQDKAGEWFLQDKQGVVYSAKLLGNSFCGHYFILLNFKLTEIRRKMSVIVLIDSLSANLFRQLQVQLLLVRRKL